jgi:hypothetical protein
VVESISGDNCTILLSEKSQGFLESSSITIIAPNSKIRLSIMDDVFVKFNLITINNKKLNFSSIEVYKYCETIEKEERGHVTWWEPNDFGGLLKYAGTEFLYNGHKYVDFDDDLSDDGKLYFVDIYDEQLLIEEYKNIFPPMKWYNMVNPQETYFDIIVDIYKTKS